MMNFYRAGGILCLLPATYRLLCGLFSGRVFFRVLPIAGCICLMLFGLPDARSQSPERQEAVAGGKEEIKPLQIGDTIPEELWNMPLQVVNHPEGKETITLSEYKDKLIILDFWATWCGSCVAAMPKLEKISKSFKNDMAVIALSHERKDKIHSFLNNNQYVKDLDITIGLNYPSAVKNFFPHRILPHYVWISAEGAFLTSTGAEAVTEDNIRKYLSESEIDINRNKVDLDVKKPLFLDHEILGDRSIGYSMLVKGKYEGLPSGNIWLKNPNGDTIGRAITNLPLVELYETAAINLFRENGDSYNRLRRQFNMQDSSLWIRDYEEGEYPYERYYTYTIGIQKEGLSNIYSEMISDLNRYSSLNGKIEKMYLPCYVVSFVGSRDKIRSRSSSYFENLFDEKEEQKILQQGSMKYFTQFLNELPFITKPVIDQTNIDFEIDISLEGFKDFSSLQKSLKDYGILINESKEWINILRLTDHSFNK